MKKNTNIKTNHGYDIKVWYKIVGGTATYLEKFDCVSESEIETEHGYAEYCINRIATEQNQPTAGVKLQRITRTLIAW